MDGLFPSHHSGTVIIPPLLARSGCKGHKNKCSERAAQFADCTDGNKSANKPPLNRDPASQRETGSTGVGGIEDCDAAAGLARVRVGFDAMLPSHSFGASWLVGGAGYRPAGASTFSRRARGVVCGCWLALFGWPIPDPTTDMLGGGVKTGFGYGGIGKRRRLAVSTAADAEQVRHLSDLTATTRLECLVS